MSVYKNGEPDGSPALGIADVLGAGCSSGVEHIDDGLRRVRELSQRFNDRFARQRASLKERYLNSDLNVVVPRLCLPAAKHSLTQPGKPPARPPMIAGNAPICRSSA